jgi:hypothetical protein
VQEEIQAGFALPGHHRHSNALAASASQAVVDGTAYSCSGGEYQQQQQQHQQQPLVAEE